MQLIVRARVFDYWHELEGPKIAQQTVTKAPELMSGDVTRSKVHYLCKVQMDVFHP